MIFIPILYFLLSIIFIAYDIILICLNPGTFLDNLFSFTHIWSFFAAILIFSAVYRIKNKHSFFKKIKKSAKLTIGSLAVICLIFSGINLGFILNPKKADLSSEGDYLILLGGGIDKNGVLPDSVLCRVEKTAEYLNNHKNTICVVSGGTLRWLPYSEAPELKRQLILRGIEEERIFVEDQALDTIQNFQKSVDLICKTQNLSVEDVISKKWIVVTSDFHLRRAERLASRMGFKNIKGISARTPIIKIPYVYLREICAYVKLNLRILFTGKPEKLA